LAIVGRGTSIGKIPTGGKKVFTGKILIGSPGRKPKMPTGKIPIGSPGRKPKIPTGRAPIEILVALTISSETLIYFVCRCP